MRFTSIRAVGMGLTLAGLSFGVVGCSSSKHASAVDNRLNAVNALGDMRTDVQKADAQVRATQVSLHDLVDLQAGDLRPSYKTFSSNVDKTIAMNDQLKSRDNAVTNTAFEYINGWNYQAHTIYDPQLRQDSINNQQQAMKGYTQLLNNSSDVQGSFSLYCQQLQDWRNFAASDLTGEGMKRLQAQTSKIDDTAKALRAKLGNLDGRANQLATSWESYIPPKMTEEGPGAAQPAGSSMPGQDHNTQNPSGKDSEQH